MNKDLQIADLCVTAETPIHDAVKCIDRSGRISLAVVVDEDRQLVCVLTDGDIRRAILRGVSLDAKVSELLPIKSLMPNSKAVTALVGTDHAALLRIMQERAVRQLPLVDEQGRVVDIVLQSDLLPEALEGWQAVIMAGGFGTRLMPFTEHTPKPMLPVGGRPLMEHLVEQLQKAGIRRVSVSTHYKAEKISDHFGDGAAFGVDINYLNEERPLGTCGSLRLMPQPDTPLLVVNGDILTGIDFRKMLEYHREHGAALTVAVNLYAVKVPYGVVDCEGSRVTALREKPEVKFFVNAGIYLLEPSLYQHIPDGEHFNMTDLIQKIMQTGGVVVSFPVHEYWQDIGQHPDYARAQEHVLEGRVA